MPLGARDLRRYRFGPFEANLTTGELWNNGKRVKIQSQPFEVLATLLAHPGEMVGREELQRRLWPGDTFVDFDLGLNVAIKKLRDALGDSAESPRYVETLARRGYRFIAPVQALDRAAAPAQPADVPATVQSRPLPARASLWLGWAALVLLLVAGTAFWQFRPLRPPPAVRLPIKSLVVLPLTNLSGDASQEYLADGITDSLITDLARLGSFQVISRTSSMQYKNTQKSLAVIARELHVDAVVEGSFLVSGGRVRVTAQLVDAASDRHLWAEQYDRDLSNVVDLERDLARDIATGVLSRLEPEQQAKLAALRPLSQPAYDAYLRGRYAWNQRTPEAYQRAIGYFQQALQIDANYAQAYAGLADSYALLGSWPNYVLPRKQAMAQARSGALKALELDPTLAEAHTSLAFVKMHYDWDWAGAEREFQRAIELNPSYSTAHHWYAYDLVAMARLDDALREMRVAERLDPVSAIIGRDVGEMLLFGGHYREALLQCRKTLELGPNFRFTHSCISIAYDALGMRAEREREEAIIYKLDEEQEPDRASIDRALQRHRDSGDRSALDREVQHLERIAARRYNGHVDIAAMYAELGDKDRAFAWYEKAYQERDGGLLAMNYEWRWRSLWSDPRFADLARRVGLPNVHGRAGARTVAVSSSPQH